MLCFIFLSVCLLGMTGGIQASRNVSGQLSQRTAANHSQNEQKCFLSVFLHLFARLNPVNREFEIHNFCSIFIYWTLQTVTYFLEYYLSSDDRLWYVNFANMTRTKGVFVSNFFSRAKSDLEIALSNGHISMWGKNQWFLSNTFWFWRQAVMSWWIFLRELRFKWAVRTAQK